MNVFMGYCVTAVFVVIFLLAAICKRSKLREEAEEQAIRERLRHRTVGVRTWVPIEKRRRARKARGAESTNSEARFRQWSRNRLANPSGHKFPG